MEIGTVKKQIKLGTLDNFYIFTGEEYKVQEIYINKISEVTKKAVVKIDSVKSLFNRGKSFVYQPKVFVVRDDRDFIKADKAWDKLSDSLKDDMLIFLWTDIDKRTKFYKKFEDKIVIFNHMKDDTLFKYTNRAVSLNSVNTKRLIDICEHDYGRILIESDKIKIYASATRKSMDESFLDLMNCGAIYVPPEDAIFNFVDMVVMRNYDKAFRLLEDCKRIGEPNLRLITVLYSNLKRILQVQACKSKDIPKSTGLTWWDVKCTNGKTNYWSNGELVYMLELLRKLEKDIKLGNIEEQLAIDYFMVNVF